MSFSNFYDQTALSGDVDSIKGYFSKQGNTETMGTPNFNKNRRDMAAIAASFIDASVQAIEDPAFDTVIWYIDFSDTSGLFADEKYTNSALAYLKRTGELQRYAMLSNVRDMLMTNIMRRKYTTQSISGLQGLYENLTKLGVQSTLQLTMLESIAWDMRYIANALSTCYWDYKRQIEILPINLRRFGSVLFISDMRWVENVIDDTNQQVFMKDNVKQHMLINIPVCELHSQYMPADISNTEPVENKAQFDLVCQHYTVDALFALLDRVVQFDEPAIENEKRKTGLLYDSKQKLTNKATAAIAGYIDAFSGNLKSAAMSKLYQIADQSGIIDAINKAGKLLKPGVATELLVDQLKTYYDGTQWVEPGDAVESTEQNQSEFVPDLEDAKDTKQMGKQFTSNLPKFNE